MSVSARYFVLFIYLKLQPTSEQGRIPKSPLLNRVGKPKNKSMINLEKFSATTNYKIYLVNKGSSTKNFWCFLQKPEGVPTSDVYANSDAMLSVVPNYDGKNWFTIPLQYKVGAGATNQAVGLNVKIDSSVIKDAQLEQLWNAEYATAPPKQGPNLSISQGEKSPANTIGIKSNKFNQVQNENEKWYSNMSFGIESANGFMGVTWAPSPNDKSTVTPKFAFYIATGDFTSNSLADIATISNEAAKIELSSFKSLEVTVTLTEKGEWLVEPGAPKA
ncbi:hypothetical protein [Myroides odoratus]|uniref:hypothetical protein n=2 Tax=Myroides odoratus TaxID=256 RepID=UPI000AAFE725|nr:hypothetical protein [Myroides odoratus]